MEDIGFNVIEFKAEINNLRILLEACIHEDEFYDGEVEDLLRVIGKLQFELESCEDLNDFYRTKYTELLPEINFVLESMKAIIDCSSDDSFLEDETDVSEFDDCFEDEEIETLSPEHQQWIEEFEESPHFDQFSEEQQDASNFILECFCEYISEFEDRSTSLWTVKIVEDFCLEIFPKEIAAEPFLFQQVGPVLRAFFAFMGEKGLLKDGEKLIERVKIIQKQIPEIAQDSTQWTPGKIFMMNAFVDNLDFDHAFEVEHPQTKLMTIPHIDSNV